MKYYIKMNKMYLKNLYVDDECVENEFITNIEFSTNKDYALTYDKDIAYLIVKKLIDIGFNSDTLYIKVGDDNEN